MGGAGAPFQKQVWWAGRQNMTVSARLAVLPVLFMYCMLHGAWCRFRMDSAL